MREILFRGKAADSGEWKYGDLTFYAGGAQIWETTDDGKWNLIVEPSTVGQFTGLLDHNGTRIYEGDIVANYNPEESRAEAVGVPVVWHDAGFCLEYPTLYHILEREDCEYLAVIGNVYDNPELSIGGTP